ncbi:MAG: hypothetical protein ABGZ35_26910 [Planctomycetaceae bacterium]
MARPPSGLDEYLEWPWQLEFGHSSNSSRQAISSCRGANRS